ncbi:unnamed protein product, partial [marine sediment metagenome]
GSLLADIPEISELPAGIQNLVRVLAQPPSAGFGDLVKLTGAETVAEVIKDAIEPSMNMLKRAINRRSLETWLNPLQAVTLSSRKKIPDEYFYLLTASAGYDKIVADSLFTAEQPYPTIPDLVLYSRYHGDPDNVWSTLQDFYNVDPVDFKVWDWLGKQRLSTLHAQTLYKRGFYDESSFYNEIARIGWHSVDQNAIRDLAYLLPNSMLLVQGGLVQGIENDKIIESISKGDIHPDYAQTYLDAILTKPASQDIVAYELRQDNALINLPEQLRKVGIHPDYYKLYQELALQIPPV